MQNSEAQAIKGISKSFIDYKKKVRNPTEEELRFHDFVHSCVQRREDNRQKKIKLKKEMTEK